MNPQTRFRMDILFGLILCIVCVLISIFVIKFDAGTAVDGSKFGENSATEKMQLVYLLSTALVFALIAVRWREWRGISILMSGGTLVLMVRELDGFFDQFFHGAWLPIAVAIGVIATGLAWPWRSRIKYNLDEFLNTPAFGAFLAACLSIFIFSRLFGMKDMWESFFGVQQLAPMQRWVKNAVEEGSELFGYTLLFLASLGFYRYVKQFECVMFCYRNEEHAEDGFEVEQVHAS